MVDLTPKGTYYAIMLKSSNTYLDSDDYFEADNLGQAKLFSDIKEFYDVIADLDEPISNYEIIEMEVQQVLRYELEYTLKPLEKKIK